MRAPRLQQGVHYVKIDSSLAAGKTQEILDVLRQPGIIDALRRVPLRSITIGRLCDKLHPAWYDSDTGSVSIDSARKLGVQYGREFRPGTTANMSSATSDKTESMRRSLLQEVAHHIENSIPGVKALVLAGFANLAKRPITRYAAREYKEYFAESLVAYIVERDALAAHDPVGSKMVEQAIALARNPK
jgi:hypothetical protein